MQRYIAEVDVNEWKRTDLIEVDGPLPDEMRELVDGGYLRKVTADEADEAERTGSRRRSANGDDDGDPAVVGGVAASAVTEPATTEGDATPAAAGKAAGAAKRAR